MKGIPTSTSLSLLVFAVLFAPCVQATDFQTPFNNVLRGKGYIPFETYRTDPVLGMLAIGCSADPNNMYLNFDLVPADTFKSSSGTAVIPGGNATFGLGALLSGLATLAQGALGLSFGVSRSVQLTEIDATSQTMQDPATVFSLPYYQNLLKAVPSGCQGYLINQVLSTTTISFTTSTNIAASVNLGSSGTCSTPPQTSQGAASTAGAAGGAGASDGKATGVSTASAGGVASAGGAATGGGKATPASSGIGGAVCLTSTNQLTLNAKTPVVFAVTVYSINGTVLGRQIINPGNGKNIRGPM